MSRKELGPSEGAPFDLEQGPRVTARPSPDPPSSARMEATPWTASGSTTLQAKGSPESMRTRKSYTKVVHQHVLPESSAGQKWAPWVTWVDHRETNNGPRRRSTYLGHPESVDCTTWDSSWDCSCTAMKELRKISVSLH